MYQYVYRSHYLYMYLSPYMSMYICIYTYICVSTSIYVFARDSVSFSVSVPYRCLFLYLYQELYRHQYLHPVITLFQYLYLRAKRHHSNLRFTWVRAGAWLSRNPACNLCGFVGGLGLRRALRAISHSSFVNLVSLR